MNPPALIQRRGGRIVQRDGLLSQETWIWLTQGGAGAVVALHLPAQCDGDCISRGKW